MKKDEERMNEEKLLAEFVVNGKICPATYKAYGAYDIEIGKTSGSAEYRYPEFVNVKLLLIMDGRECPCRQIAYNWDGMAHDEESALYAFFSAVTRGDEMYECRYMDPGLQNIVNAYVQPTEMAITVNDKPIPKKILANDGHRVYSLLMVTTKLIYYCSDDVNEYCILDINSHSIVSDNYFAELGFSGSLEAMKEGEKVLLL